MFIVKKTLSVMMMPLSIAIILLALGLLLILMTHRKRAIVLLLSGLFILIAFSTKGVSDRLLLNLESQYSPLVKIPAQISKVVVLGGGNAGRYQFPVNTQLSAASLSRLIEGIRIYRHLATQHATTLILSGGRIFNSQSESGQNRNVAMTLGVPSEAIIIENGSLDTYEEANYLKPYLKQQPFILVTSASHMPRAMKLFKQNGMKPIAAPTQFLVHQTKNPFKRYFPSATYLVHSNIALHEYFGLVDLWLRL